MQSLRQQCKQIALNPTGYRLRPELGNDIRSCAHVNYVIFFVAGASEVTVVRIQHGAGDLTIGEQAEKVSRAISASLERLSIE